MPELPELELLAGALTKHAAGRTVESVVLEPSRAFIIRYPPQGFVRELAGAKLTGVSRRAKFLLFAFERLEKSLVINPMLGGRFAFCGRTAPALPGTCFTLQFERLADLRFLDTTLMARIYLAADPAADVPGFADLGPDALDAELTFDAFEQRLRRHRGELKSLLRNQSFIAGIGNAYSDEILWAARLSPLRRASSLRDDQRRALYDALRSVLSADVAIVRAAYEAGKHPLHKQERGFMKIHGRSKVQCPRCGHRVSVVRARGQATYFCRGCQV